MTRLLSKHLLTGSDIKQVFSRNDCFHGKNLFFLFRPNQLGYPRFIPILAKKKTKNAVQRNLIRRLVKEHMRHNLTTVKALDIIVLTNKKTAASDKEAFHQCLNSFIDTVKN